MTGVKQRLTAPYHPQVKDKPYDQYVKFLFFTGERSSGKDTPHAKGCDEKSLRWQAQLMEPIFLRYVIVGHRVTQYGLYSHFTFNSTGALYAIRSTRQRSTGFSPAKLLYNREIEFMGQEISPETEGSSNNNTVDALV